MAQPSRYTIIGAGHGGKAMAAHLALLGKEVTLYNRTDSHIEIIKKRRGIELESYPDGPHGFGKIGSGHIRYERGIGRCPDNNAGCPIFSTRRSCKSHVAVISKISR